MIETIGHEILIGTNTGILTDNGTYTTPKKGNGLINKLNKSAVVDSIDINGKITGISYKKYVSSP